MDKSLVFTAIGGILGTVDTSPTPRLGTQGHWRIKMSAYVCSDAQFKALAIFAVRKTHGCMNVDPRYVEGAKDVAGQYPEVVATRYAAMLLAENVRSVRHRYADDVGDYDEVQVSESDVFKASPLAPVVILKLCANLNYQSCESDDWETTNAYKLIQQIKEAAIRSLPGYEEAPWGLDDLSLIKA